MSESLGLWVLLHHGVTVVWTFPVSAIEFLFFYFRKSTRQASYLQLLVKILPMHTAVAYIQHFKRNDGNLPNNNYHSNSSDNSETYRLMVF